MLLRGAEYAELIMEGVPQASPFSYDIGYCNDIACICKHIIYFYVLLFFAVQMLMLVCFLRMMAVGFLGVQLRQSRGDQMGFALRFRGFDATTCWGGEGCLRSSGKISQAADSLSSTWVEELPAGWVFWCSWLGWDIVTHRVVTHSDDAELYRYVVIWVIRLPISYKWYKRNRW